MNKYEAPYWNLNKLVIGIDEAGRGPLAGPLVVAGCVLPPHYSNEAINDSKVLSVKKRSELFQQIKEDAVSFQIEIVDENTIDKLNIYQATKQAMTKIAESLQAEVVLTDAMPLLPMDKKVIDLIKGDKLSISIAAASILAKVTRDLIMEEYDKLYPEYGFSKHKGYPTKAHLEALTKYGVLEIHRRSYRPVQEALNDVLTLFDYKF